MVDVDTYICILVFFFFFKQKTAYEMRISDWSSDVCSSDLKLSVVMALYKARDLDEAIRLTNEIQAYQGQGHSCGIYSRSDENIMKLANATKTSRVMVNQPQAPSNSGNLWNGMRQTFSLGCGSWGGNSTNNNIHWRDLDRKSVV